MHAHTSHSIGSHIDRGINRTVLVCSELDLDFPIFYKADCYRLDRDIGAIGYENDRLLEDSVEAISVGFADFEGEDSAFSFFELRSAISF